MLYNFTGGADGGYPEAGLIRNAAGDFFGTTGGGRISGCFYGCGVVKLNPAGDETVLYSFTGGLDGGYLEAGLTQDTAGNLYGTTYLGGVTDGGVVFKLGTSGKETVLHAFTGPPDGASSWAPVTLDAAGNLYGVTERGGAGTCTHGCGTVFKVDSAGNETVLHVFTGKDGAYPFGGLIQDAAGNLYGTTQFGGNFTGPCSPSGCGVVFQLSPIGKETVLYTFTGGADGANPLGGFAVRRIYLRNHIRRRRVRCRSGIQASLTSCVEAIPCRPTSPGDYLSWRNQLVRFLSVTPIDV